MRGIVRIAKNRDENHVILLNENKSFVEQNYHGFHELTHILTVDEPGTTLNCFGNTRPNQNTKFTVISCNKRVYDTLEISPAGTKLLKSPQNFIQCTFHTQNEAVKAAELITDENVRIFEPTDHFGCCGLYLKCSDAKKCLHPDIIRSKSCYYKKNLESGKIFYGKNANI